MSAEKDRPDGNPSGQKQNANDDTQITATRVLTGELKLPAVLQELFRDLWLRGLAPTIDEDSTITARCPLCGKGMSADVDEGTLGAWCNDGCDDDDLSRELRLPTSAERESMLDWDSDIAPPEWLIPDVVARGQFASIYGRRQSGKSLYMQEQAIRLARAGERVLYLDQENARTDVRRRFQDMGVSGRPTGLDYRCFPPVGGLDTVAGAENFVQSARAARATVIFLDTWSKFVDGQESDPSTHTRAYKYAIVPLRTDGVTVIVGDHPGKDEKAGPRGGSSKGDNVDVEWWFTSKPDGSTVRVTLTNTKDRTGRCPAVVQLARMGSPLRHEVLSGDDAHPPKVAEILTWLEKLDVPPAWGRERAGKALREAGYSFSEANLASVLKVRK